MSSILRQSRAICSLLGTTTGTRATGNVTVHSTAGTVAVPANTYGVPIVGGQMDHGVLLKTTAAASATVGGVAVPVRVVAGGPAGNLAAATLVRWDPPLTGIETTSPVALGGLTGGAVANYFGAARQIRIYEQVKGESTAQDLFAAKAGLFPALVLYWDATVLAEPNRASRTRRHATERWTLAVVSSRLDSQEERRAEALQLLDDATDILTDHAEVDGEVFTGPAPIRITGRRRLAVTPSSLVYALDFTTERTLEMQDTRTFNPWLKAQIETQTQSGSPPEEVVVRDIKVTIP